MSDFLRSLRPRPATKPVGQGEAGGAAQKDQSRKANCRDAERGHFGGGDGLARAPDARSGCEALVQEILARRMPQPPAEFLAVQVSRLNEALLVSYWRDVGRQSPGGRPGRQNRPGARPLSRFRRRRARPAPRGPAPRRAGANTSCAGSAVGRQARKWRRKRLKTRRFAPGNGAPSPACSNLLPPAGPQNGWYWNIQVSVSVSPPDLRKARNSTGSVPSTMRSNWARQWPATSSGTASIELVGPEGSARGRHHEVRLDAVGQVRERAAQELDHELAHALRARLAGLAAAPEARRDGDRQVGRIGRVGEPVERS